jgi:hypothetical protein
MRDPHTGLIDRYSDIDLTQRVPRKADWDDKSLSDFPTDDIMPVCLSNNSELEYTYPLNGEAMCKIYSRWIYETCKATVDDGLEHGFRTDAYGNVYGLKQGRIADDGQHVIDRDDYITHNSFFVHTHPLRPPEYDEINDTEAPLPPFGFSESDLEGAKTMPPGCPSCIILCPNELIETRMFIVETFDTEEEREYFMGHIPNDFESTMRRYVTSLVDNVFYHSENVDRVVFDHGYNMSMVQDVVGIFEEFIQENIVGLDVVPIKFEDGYAIPDRNLNIVPETDPMN